MSTSHFVRNNQNMKVLCRYCGSRYAVVDFSNLEYGVLRCEECAKCANCAQPIENAKNLKTIYCRKCLCSDCGGGIPTRLKDGLCLECWFKLHADRACKSCRVAAPTVYNRTIDRRKPSLCSRCSKVEMETSNILCWFCNGRANYIAEWNNHTDSYSVCDSCVSSKSCGTGACTPVRQCNNCKKLQSQMDNPYNHKPGPDCGCPSCREFNDPSIFLFVNKNVKFWVPASISERVINRSSRLAAVEIEAYVKNTSNNTFRTISDVARKWQMAGIVRDESLREDGFEINTAPAGGDFLITQIDDICAALKKAKGYVDKNGRCGLHVHIDCRDFDYFSLRRLILLYAIIEPALIRTQPSERVFKKNSHGQLRSHCSPCGEELLGLAKTMHSTEEIKRALASILYKDKYGVRPPKKYRGNNREIASRYWFLNIHSFFHRGTVECRGHSGTIRPDKIKRWVLAWVAIVDAAYKMTEKEILGLKGSPLDVVCSIVPLQSANYIRQRFAIFSSEYPAMSRLL